MVHENPSPATLRRLAREIGKRMIRRDGQAALAESFPIWRIGHESLSNAEREMAGITPGQRLMELCENTGRWHHQIRDADGNAIAYAHSIQSGGRKGDPKLGLISVLYSPLAGAIHDQLGKIDARARQPRWREFHPGGLRLLVLPEHRLAALWMQADEADHVVIVDKPVHLATLRAGKLYAPYQFLRALGASTRRERPRPNAPPPLSKRVGPIARRKSRP